MGPYNDRLIVQIGKFFEPTYRTLHFLSVSKIVIHELESKIVTMYYPQKATKNTKGTKNFLY